MVRAVSKKKKAEKPPRRFAHFDTTVPVVRPCSRCRRWLAAGISEGIHVEVDFVQLDPGQAIVAALTGIQLYSISRIGVVYLDECRLTDPRFSGRQPEHRCDIVWESKVAGAGRGSTPVVNDTPPY